MFDTFISFVHANTISSCSCNGFILSLKNFGSWVGKFQIVVNETRRKAQYDLTDSC